MQNETNTPDRYSPIAIILHWIIGFAILYMLGSGLTFANAENISTDLKMALVNSHKAIGLLLIIAVAARIIVRLATKQPPLPAALPKLDKIAAKIGHLALYVAMIIMPVSGWLIVSTSARSDSTSIFGLFNWPDLPNLSTNEALHGQAEGMHVIVAYVFIGLIAIHFAAVIKHAVIERVNLLPRMGVGCGCAKDKA